MNFPTTVDAVTKEWLSQVLGITVTGFDIHPLGEGVGLIGLVTRIRLEASSGPATLIAKFPSPAPENRAVAEMYNMYGREYYFYADIGPSINLRIARCYHAEYNPDNHDFVLLLEDLVDYQAGDQIRGCSVQETERVVKTLAALHADTWETTRNQLQLHNTPAQCAGMVAGFQLGWPVVLREFSDLVPAAARELGDTMPEAISKLLAKMCASPVCISQGDCRLDNIFFGADDVVLIDWQAISKSAPEHDLAYFITQSLQPEVQQAKDWVAFYHTELTRRGVAYDLTSCRERYRICALYLLCYAVVIVGTLDSGNERGKTMAKMLLENSLRSLDELDAFELLHSAG